MSSQSSGRRRSNNIRQYSAEDQALNVISKEAEARLAAKRAARAEAREIRMKEIEKQEKESEGKQDRVHELANEHASSKVYGRQLSGSRSGSRRGSTESNDSDAKDVDFKAEIRELEDKYKTAMMTSAQLDNEKQSLVYQVELLKDQLEEQDEGYTELQREYKEKSRDYEFMKRDLKNMEHELNILKQQLEIKDRLIQESGFIILANEKGEPVLEKQSTSSTNGPLPVGAVLVSPETKEFLEKTEGVTLGTAINGCSSNTSSCSSATGHKAGQLVSSSSVDAPGLIKEQDCVDSSTSGPGVGGTAEPCRDRAIDETVHVISDDVSTNLSLPHEHGVVLDCYAESDSSEAHSNVDNNNLDVVSHLKDDKKLDKNKSLQIPSTGVHKSHRSKGSSGDEESDGGDEFYDAVSTPSPFDKSADFVDGVQTYSEEGRDKSEGSSVDPTDAVSEAKKEEDLPPSRASLIVEQVTVTESSSDYAEESSGVYDGEQPMERESNFNEVVQVAVNESSTDDVELAVETEKSSGNGEQRAIDESSPDNVNQATVAEIISEIVDQDSVSESSSDVNVGKISTVSSLGDNEQKDDSLQETLPHSELTDDKKGGPSSDNIPEALENYSRDANDNECCKLSSPDVENTGQGNVENIEGNENQVDLSDVAAINTEIPSEGAVQDKSTDLTYVNDQATQNDIIKDASGPLNENTFQSTPEVDEVSGVNGQPTIESDVKAEPSIESDVKVEPSIESDVNVVPSIECDVKVETSIEGDVKVEPSIEGDVKVETSIEGDVKVEPSIEGDVKVEPSIEGDVKVDPSIEGDVKVEPSIGGDVKVEPSIEGDVEVEISIASDVKDKTSIESDIKDEPSIESDIKDEPSIDTDVKDAQSIDRDVIAQISTAEPTDQLLSDIDVKVPAPDGLKDELAIDTNEKKLSSQTDEIDILHVSEASSKEHFADTQSSTEAPVCNQESSLALNEEAKEPDSSQLEDNSKLLVRSSSLVGSEASDGVGLDDYDLDDIDDILEAEEGTEITSGEINKNEGNKKDEEAEKVVTPENQVITPEKVITPSPVEKAKTNLPPAESHAKLEPELNLGATSPKHASKKAESSSSHKKEKASKSKGSVKEGKKKKEDHAESKGGSHGKLDKAESQTSLETADLEGELDKQMSEAGLSKAHKKSKKFNLFKKVFTK
ncbi:unnamed protein product [Lymnaea stagnalis]|uniref:Uncharacterized protein n=1 Tax=Lymnaea stagnalis TaxID=6523 RepID=A0AAV2H6R3_LYMST